MYFVKPTLSSPSLCEIFGCSSGAVAREQKKALSLVQDSYLFRTSLTTTLNTNLFMPLVSTNRLLGGVGDEQGRSSINPPGHPGTRPAAPPSGGGRGSHGRRAGACAVLVLHSQRRYGEDPAGCPARVEPQQLLLRQVACEEAFCDNESLNTTFDLPSCFCRGIYPKRTDRNSVTQ